MTVTQERKVQRMGSPSPGELDDAVSNDSSVTKTDSEPETETDEDCATRTSTFELDDKVLAFHSSVWYEAKVRKTEFRDKKWSYLVHYRGWKDKWDEWLGVDRLREYNQAILKNQDAEAELNPHVVPPSQTKSECHVARQKKRKRSSINKEKGAITSEKLMNLHVPPTLKKQLIDDCEFITHLGKLVKLPRAPNVNDLLEKKYLEYRLKKDGRISVAVQEFVKGLEDYFNRSLPVILLYKSERQQFGEVVKDDVNPSTIYGAEHLLRLFVKLPNMLARAGLEEDTLAVFHKEVVHFLKFLQKNQNDLFLSSYNAQEESETITDKEDV